MMNRWSKQSTRHANFSQQIQTLPQYIGLLHRYCILCVNHCCHRQWSSDYCWCSSQLLQDFSNHCRKINSKVMNIMDELITKQLAKVQRVYQPQVLGPSFSAVQWTV